MKVTGLDVFQSVVLSASGAIKTILNSFFVLPLMMSLNQQSLSSTIGIENSFSKNLTMNCLSIAIGS